MKRGDEIIQINLKRILKEKDMTISELHRLTGITHNTLSLFANHKNIGVQYATLDKIIKVLNITVGELIEFTNDVYSIQPLLVKKQKYDKSHFHFNYKIIFTNTENKEDFFHLDMPFNVQLFLDPIKSKTVKFLLIETNDWLKTNTEGKLVNHLHLNLEGKPADMNKILRYIIAEDIISNMKDDYNFFIYSKIIVDFHHILQSFYFKGTYEKEKINLKTLKNASNMVHVDQAEIINLVPEDPNLEFELYEEYEITNVIPDIDSLDDLSIVYNIEFDKKTYKRSVKVILDDN